MGTALADILPFAFGLLAAPFPIVAMILLLMGGGGRARSLVFLAAWLATAFLVAFVVALLTGSRGPAGPDGSSPSGCTGCSSRWAW